MTMTILYDFKTTQAMREWVKHPVGAVFVCSILTEDGIHEDRFTYEEAQKYLSDHDLG